MSREQRHWTRLRLALRPSTIRGAWWAIRARRIAWRQLREDGLVNVELPPPPDVPDGAGLGVSAALALTPRTTCLTRALVRQAWLAARGPAPDLVVGVRRGEEAGSYLAHAWLDGEPSPDDVDYLELTRHRPPVAGC